MEVARERRFLEVLGGLLERPEEERSGPLEALAAEDAELAEDVREALAAASRLTGYLEPPSFAGIPALPLPESPPPERVGPYRLVESIGRGGMGEVFRAEQDEPVRRTVALKLVNASLFGDARGRFVAEQQALARLGHNHVARFFDAGTTGDGRPYFAMELVDGEPIDRYCARRRLTVDERLRLFLAVCAGVHHAHQKQILHRDLKPSNVLVLEDLGRPVPKIIDFGIAKSLGLPLADAALPTGPQLFGTPAYMSPEALLSDSRGDLDTRADVYSLGVLLYELVTGALPFEGGLATLVQRFLDGAEAPPTSRRVLDLGATSAEVLSERRTTAAALHRRLAGDLDGILAKALAVDRDRRYGSVVELAEDVERHLHDEPVRARPPSFRYRLGKLYRRRRAVFVTAAVALAALLIGAAGLAFGLLEARREADRARRAAAESREMSEFLTGLFSASDPGVSRGETVTARELLDRGAEEARQGFEGQPVARARFLRTIADIYVKLGLYQAAAPLLDEGLALLQDPEAGAAEPDAFENELVMTIRGQAVLQLQRLRFAESEALFRRALALQEAAARRGSGAEVRSERWMARTLHDLGVAVYRQSRFEEAEELYRRALAIRERALPPDDPHIGRSLNALGALYDDRGELEKAEPFLRQSLELREKSLGADHPDLAASLYNLSRLYNKLGRYDDAAAGWRRALAIREKALGPEHPELADVLISLGRTERLLGRPQETERCFVRALEIRRKTLPADDLLLGESLTSLCAFYFWVGPLDVAEETCRQAVTVYESRLGPQDRRVGYPLSSLGLVLWKRGRLDAAETRLQRARAIFESHYDPTHRTFAFVFWGLGGIRRDRGDLEAAAPLYRRALAIVAESIADDEDVALAVRRDAAELGRLLGRPVEADDEP